jgi:hypothetical protein
MKPLVLFLLFVLTACSVAATKPDASQAKQLNQFISFPNRTFAEWGTEKATIEAAADLKNGTPKLYISGTIAVFAQGITPEERKRLAHQGFRTRLSFSDLS